MLHEKCGMWFMLAHIPIFKLAVDIKFTLGNVTFQSHKINDWLSTKLGNYCPMFDEWLNCKICNKNIAKTLYFEIE